VIFRKNVQIITAKSNDGPTPIENFEKKRENLKRFLGSAGLLAYLRRGPRRIFRLSTLAYPPLTAGTQLSALPSSCKGGRLICIFFYFIFTSY